MDARLFRRGGGLFARWVAAILLALAIGVVAVSSWITGRITERILETSAQSVAVHLDEFVAPMVQELENGTELSPHSLDHLDAIGSSLGKKIHSVQLKVWRLDGTLAYAQDRKLIGSREDVPEIAAAKTGEIVSHLQRHPDPQEPNVAPGRSHFEVFVPLRGFANGDVIAIGELYQSTEHIDAAIRQSLGDNILVFFSALCLIAAILLIVAWQGSRTIDAQHNVLKSQLEDRIRLYENNQRLQERMVQAAQHISRIDELRKKRVGASLHDGAGQLLAFSMLKSDQLTEKLRAGDTAGAEIEAEHIRRSSEQALEEIRAISRGLLLPGLNGNRPLKAALQDVIQSVQARAKEKIEVVIDDADFDFPDDVASNLARIAQEALNNAVLHGQGRGVKLHVHKEKDDIVLTVSDNGPGIDAAPIRAADSAPRLGLLGMQFRADLIGARLSIESRASGGTLVTCRRALG